MTARQRILAIRLLEKQSKAPQLAKQIGVSVRMEKAPVKPSVIQRKAEKFAKRSSINESK
jgi:hypothetical protein